MGHIIEYKTRAESWTEQIWLASESELFLVCRDYNQLDDLYLTS